MSSIILRLMKAFINATGTTAEDYSELRQSVQLTQGVTYTFSAYVNTDTVNQFWDGYGAYIGFWNGRGRRASRRLTTCSWKWGTPFRA